MKRRILAFVSAVILSITIFCVPAYADDKAVGMVIDDADIFTKSQESTLLSEAQEVASKTGLNIVVYTTEDVGADKSDDGVMDFADVKYEQLCGINTDGVLLLINNDTKYDWISTSGAGINYLSDYRIESIFSAMDKYYDKDDLYEASRCFVRKVSTYCSQGKANNQQEVFGSELDLDEFAVSFFSTFMFTGFIGLIVALCLYAHFSKQYAISKPETSNYTLKDSLYFTQRTDNFMGNVTHRTYSPRSSGSSSGGHSHSHHSSTHHSSGGGRHGGGGHHR